MKPLRISGAMKVAAGFTTIEEVLKTAPPAHGSGGLAGVAWSELVDALLLVTGGLVLFGVWYGARRRDRRATQALRLSEERFRHLTSLSADWFWETDAEHRVSWLSGGRAVAALFGAEMAHGKRLWEVPGVEVEPRALVEHFGRLQQLDAQLPFFDFVISRRRRRRAAGARGQRQAALRRRRPLPRLPRRGAGHHRQAPRGTRARRGQGAPRARHRGRQPGDLGLRPRRGPGVPRRGLGAHARPRGGCGHRATPRALLAAVHPRGPAARCGRHSSGR